MLFYYIISYYIVLHYIIFHYFIISNYIYYIKLNHIILYYAYNSMYMYKSSHECARNGVAFFWAMEVPKNGPSEAFPNEKGSHSRRTSARFQENFTANIGTVEAHVSRDRGGRGDPASDPWDPFQTRATEVRLCNFCAVGLWPHEVVVHSHCRRLRW